MTRAKKVGKLSGWCLFSERCKCVLEEACGLGVFFKMYFSVRRADPLGDTPPSKHGLKVVVGVVVKLYVFSKANYWQVVGNAI